MTFGSIPPELPDTSFVAISTHRLVAPMVAWTDGERFTEEIALTNAFCIMQSYEPDNIYLSEVRTQYADRYGGYGVGHAGGSGRCATIGTIQIKGVGRTPLVTPKLDPFHTSGTVSLQEAGREVIWSQILQNVLPHGVVPPLAIVLTGGVDPQGNGIPRQRTLLFREFALRPAHYLRNINFKTSEVGVGGLCQDACRARDAINMLHLGFDEVLGRETASANGIEKINLGLRSMAKRFAAQIAASFAKRIFHGALNCSNIALDGRFLDFGVTTFVEAYRRRAWAKGWLDQWEQHEALLRTLHLLRFQLKKHLHNDEAKSLLSEAELVAEFRAALANRQEIEMLKMTGIPEEFISNYPLGNRQRLFRCLRNIYSHGAGEVFTTWPAHVDTVGSNPPPSRGGRFDLNEILALASTCIDSGDLDRTLTESLSDGHLRREFVERYGNFVDWVVSQFDPDLRKATRIYFALQAVRLNADISFLKREALDEKLTVFDTNPAGVGDFIDETVNQGRYFVQQNHPDLPGNDANSQIDSLMKMEVTMPEFVMGRVSVSSTSPLVFIGMKRMLEYYEK
jgi:hypothetical protein